MTEDSITTDRFRRACGLWATGVSIVTTVDAAGNPYGLTMNAVTSLSLDPPLLLVCVDNGSDTLAPMLESRVFCVNVLTPAQESLSNRFAKKGDDKFAGVEFSAGVTGAPVLNGTLISMSCEIEQVIAGGDHQIVCGRVREIVDNDSADAAPLLFFGGRYGALTKA